MTPRSLLSTLLVALTGVGTLAAQAIPREELGLNGLPRVRVNPAAAAGSVSAEAQTEGIIPLSPPAAVAVPLQFAYQGFLTDAGGTPLSGAVNLTFSLYTDPSGPTPVWTQTQNGVAVTDGVVSPLLGPFPTNIFTGQTLYLGVRVNGGAELTPRTTLVSQPYAVRAGFTDRLDTVAIGETLQLGQAVNGQPGRLEVFNDRGDIAGLVTFNTDRGGFIAIRRPESTENAVTLNTSDSDGDGQGGGSILVNNDRGDYIIFATENSRDGGVVATYNREGTEVATVGSDTNHNGFLSIANTANEERVFIGIDPSGNGAIIVDGIRRFDIAEVFEFSDRTGIAPGMVVAMDPDNPGLLRLSTQPYDPLVAGVISGAGASGPGLTLGSRADGSTDLPLSLAGVVAVWADADPGPIRPGDLLTTAARPGHAMRAADPGRAFGATLGKALEGLDSGQGLIQMLVTLR